MAAEQKQEEIRVVITGANRGIGFEFSKQLLQREGYCVVALCRKPDKADELKALQQEYKDRVSILKWESTNDQDIENVNKALKDKPIDILLLNAGILGGRTDDNQLRKLGNLTRDDVLNTFNVNTAGPMLLAQALYNNVAASTRKQIIGVSTGMGSIDDCGSNSAVCIYFSLLLLLTSSTFLVCLRYLIDAQKLHVCHIYISVMDIKYECMHFVVNMAFMCIAKQSEANKDGVHAMALNPGWVATGIYIL